MNYDRFSNPTGYLREKRSQLMKAVDAVDRSVFIFREKYEVPEKAYKDFDIAMNRLVRLIKEQEFKELERRGRQ